MPVIIEFSRCIGTYSSAKFEFEKLKPPVKGSLRYVVEVKVWLR